MVWLFYPKKNFYEDAGLVLLFSPPPDDLPSDEWSDEWSDLIIRPPAAASGSKYCKVPKKTENREKKKEFLKGTFYYS